MSRPGYALTETLAALAVGALIIGGLVFLHADYAAMSRRTLALAAPYRDGARLERAAGFAADPCRERGAVFAAPGSAVVVDRGDGSPLTPVLGAAGIGRETHLFGPQGVAAGRVSGGPRLKVASAIQSDGVPRGGWSVASLEAGSEPIVLLAMRCDLPEVCETAGGTCVQR